MIDGSVNRNRKFGFKLLSSQIIEKRYKSDILTFKFRSCPSNYTCMPHAGPNPDHGYTSFDNIGWSLVMALQILTMDYWENVYDKVP